MAVDFFGLGSCFARIDGGVFGGSMGVFDVNIFGFDCLFIHSNFITHFLSECR